MPYVRTATNIAPRPTGAPATRFTRAAPDALYYRLAGDRSVEAQTRIWGRFPLESVEGHEPDPYYDVRLNAGLAGPPRLPSRGFEPWPTARDSYSTRRPVRRRRTGLGQGIPVDISQNLDRIADAIADGIGKAKARNRQDLVARGEAAAQRWMIAQQLALVQEDFPAARNEIVHAFNVVVPWLKEVNLAYNTSGAESQKKSEAESSWLYQIQKQYGEAAQTVGGAAELAAISSRWALPVAIGGGLLLLFLLARR